MGKSAYLCSEVKPNNRLSMIESKDLMLGDWVKVELPVLSDSSCCLVTALYDRVLLFKGDDAVWHSVTYDQVSPILVTEELLERIGFRFERRFEMDYWVYESDNFNLTVDNLCNNTRSWNVHIDNSHFESLGDGNFDSLHGLQNLVRVITGFDLPISKDMLP